MCDSAAAAGVAGERELALTVYLIGTSRLLPRPLAGIIRGSSSEATRALREMLSGQRLSKLMPVKTGNTIETALIEQEGPIAFTETTTLANVFEEEANRCLLLQTDETPDQTRRIVQALARRHAGAGGGDGRAAEVHHAIQRLLPAAPVVVPWAGRLAELFDCSRVEVRRAFPQLLALVQASALLHHRQRPLDDNGAVVANANDYNAVVGPARACRRCAQIRAWTQTARKSLDTRVVSTRPAGGIDATT